MNATPPRHSRRRGFGMAFNHRYVRRMKVRTEEWRKQSAASAAKLDRRSGAMGANATIGPARGTIELWTSGSARSVSVAPPRRSVRRSIRARMTSTQHGWTDDSNVDGAGSSERAASQVGEQSGAAECAISRAIWPCDERHSTRPCNPPMAWTDAVSATQRPRMAPSDRLMRKQNRRAGFRIQGQVRSSIHEQFQRAGFPPCATSDSHLWN